MLKLSLKSLAICVLALAGSFGPADARSFLDDLSNHELRDRMRSLEKALAAMSDQALSANLLLEQAGLASIVNPQGADTDIRLGALPTKNDDPIEVEVLDMRIPLAMLAQSHGTKGNGAIQQSQLDGSNDAIVLRSGSATLSDIKDYIRNYRLQDPAIDPDHAVTVPIVIWQGAVLRMNAADTLNLSRAHGTFLINFGELDIQGGTIASYGEENPVIRSFRPFVVTAGSGVAKVINGTFRGLGFGKTDKYSGFAVLKNALLGVNTPSTIVDSLFVDLNSVTVIAVKGAEISGNRFRDMRGTSLVLKRSRNALVERNIFFGESPFNAIRMLNGSNKAMVRGNVILRGERTGIVVRSGSDGVTVSNNIVWNRAGGGITIGKSHCGRIYANLIMDNKRKGIEIRTSDDTTVEQNYVVGNKSAAIWVSAQEAAWGTHLGGNVLRANGSGLATATAAQVALVGNDFSGQTLRLLDGDFAAQSRHLAMDTKGKNAMILSAVGRQPFVALETDCPE